MSKTPSRIAEENLKKAFQCPKCHGKEGDVRRISISSSPLSGFIPLVSGKYLAVTCTLCGFTELYDESVYQRMTQKAGDDLEAPQEA